MTISHMNNPFASRAVSRDAVHSEIDALFRLEDEDAGELLLIRHAEPAPGSNDPLLSCAGLEQAERLADRLRSVWVEAVYMAPERRAVQTANVIASTLDRPQHLVEGLADIEFDSSSIDETAGTRPQFGERFAFQPRWDSLPGFPDSREFRCRAIQAVEGAIAAHEARRVVIVTHTSVINAYLSMILGVPGDQFFTPEHTSISVVRWCRDRYALRSLNDVAHLGMVGSLPAGRRELLPAVDYR